MAAGWREFTLLGGMVDHLLLGVRHLQPGPGQLAYDLGFLVLGGCGPNRGNGIDPAAKRALTLAE